MGEEVKDPYSKWVEDCRYSSSQEQLFTIIECDLPVNLSYYKYYNPKSWCRGEGSSSSSRNQNGKSPADKGKGLSSPPPPPPPPPPRDDSSVDEDDVVVVVVDESPDKTLSKVSHPQMEWETTAQVVPTERGDTSSSVFHCALNSREDIIDLFPEIAGEIPLDNSKKTEEVFGPDECKKVSSETTQVSKRKSHVREEDSCSTPRLYAQTMREFMDHVFKGSNARQQQEVAGEIPLHDSTKRRGKRLGNVDILEIAEKRGMKFFRPRWWPWEEEEEDEEGL